MSDSAAASIASPAASPSTGSPAVSSGAAGAESGKSPTDAAKLAAPEDAIDIDGERLTRAQIAEMYKRRKDMDRGAYAAMQKASELEKREQFIRHTLATDPAKLFEAAGLKFDDAAQQYLSKRLEEASLSPEEAEKRQYQRDRAEFEANKKKFEDDQKQQTEERETSAWTQRYNEQLAAIMDKRGLPRTAETVARMAKKTMAYWEQGIEVPFDVIADAVEEDIAADYGHQLSPILKDGAALAKRLGPDGVEAIRKYLVAEARRSQPRAVKSQPTKSPPTTVKAENPNGYVGWDEWREVRERRP